MPEWAGKKVVVLGMARQGKALAKYFSTRGAEVVLSDLKTPEELEREQLELIDLKVTYVLGEHPTSLLENADILCLSGGVPADIGLAEKAREEGIPITNDAQIFLENCPAPVIGITGSAGKTTTTTLVAKIAEQALGDTDRTVWLGGNIGRPLLNDIEEMKSSDVVVMELSSFQLELMTMAPQIGAYLNLTPDHLDRHKTMEKYASAKARILLNQSEGSGMVLNRDDFLVWELKDKVIDRLISFGWDEPIDGEGSYISGGQIRMRHEGADSFICSVDQVPLIGKHNLSNVLAATAIIASADLSLEAIGPAIERFEGVPHRLEFVRTIAGVDWYNDSIATTPDRALAAVHAFSRPLVLIAGGRDKDLNWDNYAVEVLQAVEYLILFGEAGEKIERAVKNVIGAGKILQIRRCERMEDAVGIAKDVAGEGDVVVLSPGATSFDEFSNYEARGDKFRDLVRAM